MRRIRSRLTYANAAVRRVGLLLAFALALSSFMPFAPADAASSGRTKVICITSFSPARGAYRYRPHKCVFHKRHAFPINSSNLASVVHLRWYSWGAAARGRGKIGLNMVGLKRVKVTLTGRRTICHHRVYTKARFKFRLNGKTHHERTPIDNCLS